MSWHAVRAIREAGVTTRGFLLPFKRGRLLRLVALSLVVGVGWLAPPALRAVVPASVVPDGVAATVVVTAVGFVALSGLLADAYARFALLSALRSRRLRLLEDVRWRLGRSVRWVAFGFSAGVLVVAAVGVALRALRAGWLAVTGGDPTSVVGVVATAIAGTLAVLLGVGLVGFAHATVTLLPATMLATGVGALGSWRRLRRAFSDHGGGFVGYLLVRGLVALAVTGVALLAAGVILASLGIVAFVVLVGVFGTVSNGIATLGGAPTVVGAAATALALVVVPLRALTVTYLAGYDLAALGAVDEDLALLDTGSPDAYPDAGAVSVVLPDGTRAGGDGTDASTDDSADGTGATGEFEFGAVESTED